MNRPARSEMTKKALIVHPDVAVLSGLQNALTSNGVTAIVARDLPTALLAITQHYFDLCIVGSRIAEEGDGWPVAGVLRMVFPKAFLLMMAPQTDVLTLKAAINNGVDEVLDHAGNPGEVVGHVLQRSAEVRRTVQ